MTYLGDYTEDFADLNFGFSTNNISAVPTTLSSGVVSVYKSNNNVQTTTGVTLSADFDGVTGLNNVKIDLSADAFYVTGEDYKVVITTGTVSSVSVVGIVVAHFSIENRFGIVATDIVSSGAITTSGGAVSTVTTTGTATNTGTVTGNVNGSVGSVTGAVGSVTASVTVGTNNDKTGYSISGAKTTLDALNDIAATSIVSAGAITTLSGAVVTTTNLSTNNDKTGYSISGTKTTLDALNDIAATSIVSSGAITTSSGAVSNVTLVATTTDLTNAGSVNVTQIAGSTTAATQLALSTNTIVSAAAESGTLSLTQMTSSLTEATDDHYIGRIIIWTSGNLQNQATDITDYSGATGLLTFTAVTDIPQAADTFIIV